MNPIGNKESKIFPNQVIDGRDQELYPKRVPDVPAKYHEKLNSPNKAHLYPELFEGEEDENGVYTPSLDENGLPIPKVESADEDTDLDDDDDEEDDGRDQDHSEAPQPVLGASSSMTTQDKEGMQKELGKV